LLSRSEEAGSNDIVATRVTFELGWLIYAMEDIPIILIKDRGKMRNYISYIESLDVATVQCVGKGRAMTKVITVVEVVKGLKLGYEHQVTEIHMEQDNEGNAISVMTVTLSKLPLDTKNPGYQLCGESTASNRHVALAESSRKLSILSSNVNSRRGKKGVIKEAQL